MGRIDEAARQFVREVDGGVDPALARLVEELAAALPRLVAEAERLAATVTGAPGESLARAFAARRAALIAAQVEAELRTALSRLERELAAQQQTAVEQALAHSQRLAELALPEAALARVGASAGPTWNRLPVEAVQHLVGAAGPGTPLGDLLAALGTDSGRRLRERLVSGIAGGKHPSVIARGLREEAALTRSRAESIARTEVLRAYRAASAASYQANPEVVKGYRRLAAKDRRSCVLCLALDGEQYASDELMPSHPRCRCTMLPVTASWTALGFPEEVQRLADAGRAPRESGAAWFRRQDGAAQRAMLGPGGHELYRRGAELRDFVGVHDSPEWGPTLRRRRLEEVEAKL